MTRKNLYRELRKTQQKRVDSILNQYAFFAFSDEQFREGLQRFGLSTDPDDLKKIVRFFGGGYILKDHAGELRQALTKNHEELHEALHSGADFAHDAFLTELYDHEYSYTGDPTDAVEALGLTMEEVLKDEYLNTHLAGAMQYIQEHVQE